MFSDLIRLLYFTLTLALLTAGCSEHFVKPEISDTPETVFEIVWDDIDRYYPFFTDKNIDWDSVYTVYRSQVDNNMSDDELFRVLADMLETLRDGHVNLYTPLGTASYTGWYDQYPTNFYYNIVLNRYLQSHRRTTGGGNILYGTIGSIGYIHIRSFSGEGDWAKDIDNVLQYFPELDGLIVDVRHNGGGSGADGQIIASRFADRERLYSFTQFRNGPRHDDFTSLESRSIAPGGPKQFLGPIVLLTNRSTYSAAEDFTLMMKEFPYVTHLGDTTGGGLGNPVFRELPNGWGYRLPVWRQITAGKEPVEGIGIAPDEAIDITPGDLQLQRDTILERALELLIDG